MNRKVSPTDVEARLMGSYNRIEERTMPGARQRALPYSGRRGRSRAREASWRRWPLGCFKG